MSATEQAIAAVERRRIDPTSPELAEVYERIVKGIAWLVEHDPLGAFHFWFESGIGPRAPMPGMDRNHPETREKWVEYYTNRGLFEKLWAKMVRLEAAETRGQETTT